MAKRSDETDPPRVNWFSPLPAARTGIAEYSSTLLTALGEQSSLTVWTDQEEAVSIGQSVRRFSVEALPWAEINTAETNIYHIGNNGRYHSGIWQVSRRHRGIVVLHDTSLQHLFIDHFLNRCHDYKGYVGAMEAHYGMAGREAAQRACSGATPPEQLAELFPLTEMVLENTTGIVVHSKTEWKRIVSRWDLPAAYLPLPYNSGRGRHNLVWSEGPPYRIIAFGFIGPTRRLIEFMEAWSTLNSRSAFLLDIVGEVWDSKLLLNAANSLGLGGMVQCHGYVAEDTLKAMLARADLAVNLRYPTMGEGSLSQLLIWQHALPALVTKAGWYEECAPSTVAFVRPEREAADIKEHLRAFLLSPGQYRQIGERGQKVLANEHDVEKYAKGILEFAAAVTTRLNHDTVTWFANRLTTEIPTLSDGDPGRELISHVCDELIEMLL